MKTVLLNVENLKKYFPILGGIFGKVIGYVKAVDDISFSIYEGETFALVGESGSGKTTVGKIIVGIYKPDSGKIIFNGYDLFNTNKKFLKKIKMNISMVFQDPASSLNPRKRVIDIVMTPLNIYKIGSKQDRIKRVRELINLVELTDEYLYKYPYSLSGGQKQRVAIARALALNPRFIVLDEPTSALDVSVQAKILKLLIRLQKMYKLTYMLITHDLSIVRNVADRVAVMYLGNIVEIASTEELFHNPLHPYTRALLSSIPVITNEEAELLPEKVELKGEIPSPVDVPSGCPFHPRCYARTDICDKNKPALKELRKEHFVACHLF